MNIIFYEKAGCLGNKKQKELLKAHEISFKVSSMLDENWDKKTLEGFFEGLEKEQIINQFAPKIKSGEFKISNFTKDELIDKMIKEPILIKRPLIKVDDTKICGFDIEKLNKALNLDLDSKREIGTCQSSDSCTSV